MSSNSSVKNVSTSRYAPDQVPVGERRVLLDRAKHGGRVLDVGCWSGFNGRYLTDTYGLAVDGVEPDPAMAAAAQHSYRKVFASTIDSALDDISREPDYGSILMLDVLEHLVNPGEVLLRLAHLAARPDTVALISIPNIAHWTVRKQLLMGRWEYEDSGLLDDTHLRFFTLSSARRLIEENGWRITWESVELDQPPVVRLSARRLRHLARWPQLFGVQLLFAAVPR